MKNYYEILQVDKNANPEIINRIYKYHIKKNHPDLFEGKEKEEAQKRVQQFNEAYDVLSNEVKRKEYDENLKHQESEEENSEIREYVLRLEEENQILHDELMHKENVIKNIFEKLGMPYESNLNNSHVSQNINNGQNYTGNYNSAQDVNSNENFDSNSHSENHKHKKYRQKSPYVEHFKISILKLISYIFGFVVLLSVFSKLTGNNYVDFFKSFIPIK